MGQAAFNGSVVVAPVVGVTTAAEPTPPAAPTAQAIEIAPEQASATGSRAVAARLPDDGAMLAAERSSVTPEPAVQIPQPPKASAPELPVRLKIDSIGLDTKVVRTGVVGGVWQVADFAAGYMAGTGLPGQPGNVAVAGHDDIQGEVFRHLKSVAVGDPVALSTANHQFRYVVDSIRYVNPDDVSVLDPSSDARLTLITCWPDFSTSKASYNSLRLIVEARLAA